MTDLIFDGDTVSSRARTSRAGGGKARTPVPMRELLKSGRWSNGDRLSSSDAYEIASRLIPDDPKKHARAIRTWESS